MRFEQARLVSSLLYWADDCFYGNCFPIVLLLLIKFTTKEKINEIRGNCKVIQYLILDSRRWNDDTNSDFFLFTQTPRLFYLFIAMRARMYSRGSRRVKTEWNNVNNLFAFLFLPTNWSLTTKSDIRTVKQRMNSSLGHDGEKISFFFWILAKACLTNWKLTFW